MRRTFRWLGFGLLALILTIAGPILYTETMCRGEPLSQAPPTHITDPDQHRPEARTYMVYPEWHIVYAYEGYAEALKDGAPHQFPYLRAVAGFWSALCGLTAEADALGEAGFNSKATIYTIGASFTLEMLFKAAYEETIGRAFSWLGRAPQDDVERDMAADYAEFLQQTPWYKYDFPAWSNALWAVEPVPPRGWERRIALGLEWQAKTQYAKLIAQAAAGLGSDALTMQIAARDLPIDIANITTLKSEGSITIAEVPRYRIFTGIAQEIANGGGTLLEIAGNDDILISHLAPSTPILPKGANLISTTARVGFDGEFRHLISVKVPDLSAALAHLTTEPGRIEHIYDY